MLIFGWVFALLIVCSRASFAAPSDDGFYRDLSVTPLIEVSYVMGGEAGDVSAGDTRWTPDTAEFFDAGLGGGIEVGLRFDTNWEAIFGMGYMYYPGGGVTLSDEAGNRIIMELDDMRVIPIYAGVKLLLSEDPTEGFVPYIRGDVGVVWLSDVDARILLRPQTAIFNPGSARFTWFESSYRFMWDIGGGLEYRFAKWGAFVELLGHNFSTPKNPGHFFLDNILIDTDGTGFSSLKARIGAHYYF